MLNRFLSVYFTVARGIKSKICIKFELAFGSSALKPPVTFVSTEVGAKTAGDGPNGK